jgi:hypothetical protein
MNVIMDRMLDVVLSVEVLVWQMPIIVKNVPVWKRMYVVSSC